MDVTRQRFALAALSAAVLLAFAPALVSQGAPATNVKKERSWQVRALCITIRKAGSAFSITERRSMLKTAGVIEAKKEGSTLVSVEIQTQKYSKCSLDIF